MARVYHHRRGGTQKKAKPMEAFYAAIVSLGSIIAYIIVVTISVYYAGETSRWIGGVGMLGFCLAIGAFAFNIRQMKNDTDVKEKIACMSVSSIALLIWLVTFVLGMIK